MATPFIHIPVLLQEVLTYLKPEPKTVWLDGTVGLGGHSEALLTRALPESRLLAMDRDPQNLALAKQCLSAFTDAVIFVSDSFAHAKKHAYAHGLCPFDGILLDLGFSSAHLQDASRGFSFLAAGPLDMRYDPSSQILTAEEIVNTWSEDELARIFRVYGEELKARRFAQAIVKERVKHPLKTTTQLADLIEQEVGYRGKIHPATQIFQALRIAVNDELGELERALPDLAELLKPGGRIAIISFHSLEDRVVKTFFQQCDQLNVVTKKPVTATQTEIKQNPRARSAKLRVAEKK